MEFKLKFGSEKWYHKKLNSEKEVLDFLNILQSDGVDSENIKIVNNSVYYLNDEDLN